MHFLATVSINEHRVFDCQFPGFHFLPNDQIIKIKISKTAPWIVAVCSVMPDYTIIEIET